MLLAFMLIDFLQIKIAIRILRIVVKAHLDQFVPAVQLIVSRMRCWAQILQIDAEQHLAQMIEIAVWFIFDLIFKNYFEIILN